MSPMSRLRPRGDTKPSTPNATDSESFASSSTATDSDSFASRASDKGSTSRLAVLAALERESELKQLLSEMERTELEELVWRKISDGTMSILDLGERATSMVLDISNSMDDGRPEMPPLVTSAPMPNGGRTGSKLRLQLQEIVTEEMEEEMLADFARFDAHKTGSFSLDQYIRVVMAQYAESQGPYLLLRRQAENGATNVEPLVTSEQVGQITARDSEQEFVSLFEEIDCNKDGLISLDEFAQAWVRDFNSLKSSSSNMSTDRSMDDATARSGRGPAETTNNSIVELEEWNTNTGSGTARSSR